MKKNLSVVIFIFLFLNLLFYNEIQAQDTIYEYDTIVEYIYETVYEIEDTLPEPELIPIVFDDTLKNKIELPSKFSKQILPEKKQAEIFFNTGFSGIYPNFQFVGKPYDLNTFIIKKKTVSPVISYSINTSLDIIYKNSSLNTGISYRQIYEQFRYTSIFETPDTSYYFDYFTRTEQEIDTIWYLNLDTLLQTGDSVYFPLLDTNYVQYNDSVRAMKIDTIRNSKKIHNLNKYSFLQIPLIYGHRFYYKKYSMIAEIGLLTNFILNSQGNTLSLLYPFEIKKIEDENKFLLVSFSIHAGLGIDYKLSERLFLNAKVFYRKGVNSIYKDYPIGYIFDESGFYFGLKYKLGSLRF